MTAAGTGLTLTAAECAIFAELAWNPGTMCVASPGLQGGLANVRAGPAFTINTPHGTRTLPRFQAEDRAHRIGQQKAVFIKYILCRNTYDDTMWELAMRKNKVRRGCGRRGRAFLSVQSRIFDAPSPATHPDAPWPCH